MAGVALSLPSLRRRLYRPACKPYGLEAEPEATMKAAGSATRGRILEGVKKGIPIQSRCAEKTKVSR